jgi:outer membrane protein TolC
LVKNYKQRPQLSPEQSTSLFLFELARKDYELQQEDTLAELNRLVAELKQRTGYSLEEVSHLLPARKKTWPKNIETNRLESPYLRVLRAQTEAAEMDLKLAKADAWPTLNIGPGYTSQNQFGEQAKIWGLVLSFPIPILNQNDGAKAIAATIIATNKKRYEIEKSVQDNYREAYLKTYLSSIEVLEGQTSDAVLHEKHEEVEKYFLRGLISSPLVIEAHRQMFENKKLFHQRELATLDAYYQIVLLDGGKVEEKQ